MGNETMLRGLASSHTRVRAPTQARGIFGGIMESLKEIVQPPDADAVYAETQVRLLAGDDEGLQFLAAKELAQLSSDVPATGISAGVLGAHRTNMHNAGVL